MKARAMTDKEEYEVRAYSALIYKEYGYQIPTMDPLMPVLYIHHKEMQLNSKKNEAIALTLKDALSKVNPQSLHFNQPGEAWEFQLVITLRRIVVGVFITLISYSAVWFWSMHEEINKARSIIQVSTLINELLERTEIDAQGRYFIDFASAKNDSPKPMTEYKKINSSTIRVYLPAKTKE